MKIIVLGATGHLGAYTALALKDSGHKVIAVGHRKSDNGFFITKQIDFIGGFDLSDANAFHSLPTDIDAVIHLAGTMPAHADASPMPYIQSIVVGMVNLCEWLKNTTTCRRVIFNTTPSDVCKFLARMYPCLTTPRDLFQKMEETMQYMPLQKMLPSIYWKATNIRAAFQVAYSAT